MISLGDLILFFRGDSKDLDRSFKDTEKSAEGWTNRVGGIVGDGLKTLIAGAAVGVSSAVAGIGVAAFKMADDTQAATNKFKTQLGATTAEAERLKNVTLSVFGANFGDDMNDAAEAVAQVQQNLADFGVTSDQELQAASQNAIMLRDAFGIELNESVGAVQALMRNFGLTSQQAFDFITTGQQNGLNLSGDFLETISEYAPLFSNAGASADQFYSLMANGAQSGVAGTDFAADAFKEFGLRIGDGSKATAEALAGLGINANKLWAEMSAGTTSSADAFEQVIIGLNGIDDPLKRNAIGVALLGTKYEDLGATGALSLDLNTHKLEDMAGATDTLNAQYDTLGSILTGVWRTFSVNVLGPIGEQLMTLARSIVPALTKGLEQFGQAISGGQGLAGIVSALGTMVMNAWPAIQSALASLAQNVITWAMENTGPLLQSLGQWTHALAQWAIDAAPGLISALGGVLQAMLNWVSASYPAWLQYLMQLGQGLVQMAIDAAPGLLSALGNVLTQMINWVVDSIPQWAENLKQLGIQLWQWIVDMMPELGQRLGEVLNVIITWIGNTIATVGPKLLELAGAFLSWIWNDVIPNLPGTLANIFNALTTFIAGVITGLAPHLAELAGKFYNWITDEVVPAIPEKLGQVWDSILAWIQDTAGKAWEAAKAIGASIADGIGGAISSGLDALHGMVASVINPLIDGINLAIDGMNLLGAGISHIPRMAKGGRTPGGLVILGEQGPERVQSGGVDALAGPGLYNLPAGMKVTPHAQTMQQLSNAGAAGASAGRFAKIGSTMQQWLADRLAEQNDFFSDMEQAAMDHYQRLADIESDFQRASAAATEKWNVDKFQIQATFWDRIATLPAEQGDRMINAEVALWEKSRQIAEDGRATEALEFYQYGLQIMQAQEQRNAAIATLQEKANTASTEAERARYEREIEIKRRANEQLTELENQKLAAIQNSEGQLQKDRAEAISDEQVRYDESLGKIKEKFIESLDKANEKIGQSAEVMAAFGDTVSTLFDRLASNANAAAAALASIPPIPTTGAEGRASGGPIIKGRLYQYAEHGAELMRTASGALHLLGTRGTGVAPDDGYIYNHAETMGMLAGAASTGRGSASSSSATMRFDANVNITINGNGSSREISQAAGQAAAASVTEALAKALGTSGIINSYQSGFGI